MLYTEESAAQCSFKQVSSPLFAETMAVALCITLHIENSILSHTRRDVLIFQILTPVVCRCAHSCVCGRIVALDWFTRGYTCSSLCSGHVTVVVRRFRSVKRMLLCFDTGAGIAAEVVSVGHGVGGVGRRQW